MATIPRMPEVGASPLLSRKVVDKPIVDPLLQSEFQQPQPQPQPQYQPQPEPQQQAQPQPQPQPKVDPYRDQSMDHLTPPQQPLNDPNIRSMSFDELKPPGEQEGEESGGEGEKSTVKIPTAEAKEFAELMVGLGGAYIPMFCAKLASVNINELKLLEAQGVVPHGSTEFFARINESTALALQLTDEETKMLTDALTAYIKWKNIEAANPGTALAIAVGVVCIRLGVTTVQNMSQNRAMYKDFLEKNYAPRTTNITVEADETPKAPEE